MCSACPQWVCGRGWAEKRRFLAQLLTKPPQILLCAQCKKWWHQAGFCLQNRAAYAPESRLGMLRTRDTRPTRAACGRRCTNSPKSSAHRRELQSQAKSATQCGETSSAAVVDQVKCACSRGRDSRADFAGGNQRASTGPGAPFGAELWFLGVLGHFLSQKIRSHDNSEANSLTRDLVLGFVHKRVSRYGCEN